MFATKRTTDGILIDRQARWIAAHNLYVQTDSMLQNRDLAVRIQTQRADNNMHLYQGVQENYDALVSKKKQSNLARFLEGLAVGAATGIVVKTILK